MKNRKKGGFTLAELLLVVAIIAVLVSIAIPIFIRQLERSKESTDITSMRSAYSLAVTSYKLNEKVDGKRFKYYSESAPLYYNESTGELTSYCPTAYGKGTTLNAKQSFDLNNNGECPDCVYAPSKSYTGQVIVTWAEDKKVHVHWATGTPGSQSSPSVPETAAPPEPPSTPETEPTEPSTEPSDETEPSSTEPTATFNDGKVEFSGIASMVKNGVDKKEFIEGDIYSHTEDNGEIKYYTFNRMVGTDEYIYSDLPVTPEHSGINSAMVLIHTESVTSASQYANNHLNANVSLPKGMLFAGNDGKLYVVRYDYNSIYITTSFDPMDDQYKHYFVPLNVKVQ